jgi:hypothetical protein
MHTMTKNITIFIYLFEPVLVSKTTAICLLFFGLSFLLQLAFKVPFCFMQNPSNDQKFVGTRLCSISKPNNPFFIID